MPTYRGEAYWPVLYAVRFDIEAATPEEAMAKLKDAHENDYDPEAPQQRTFFETSESCDDSDGDTSLAIWDDGMRETLLEEPSEDERYRDAAPALIAALEKARSFIGDQGDEKTPEEMDILTEIDVALAKAKGQA